MFYENIMKKYSVKCIVNNVCFIFYFGEERMIVIGPMIVCLPPVAVSRCVHDVFYRLPPRILHNNKNYEKNQYLIKSVYGWQLVFRFTISKVTSIISYDVFQGRQTAKEFRRSPYRSQSYRNDK